MLIVILYLITFFAALLGMSILFGLYIAKVYEGKKFPILQQLESISYRLCSIQPQYEMNTTQYIKSFLLFHLLGFGFLFLLQLLQAFLPLNPESLKNVFLDLDFNTTISFITNTNWQAYSGETTLSTFTQMVGLTPQNFLSASCGLSVLFVLMRGLSRKNTTQLGNFWQDLIRIILYIFLPLAILLSLFYVSQGVPQSFHPNIEAITLEGQKQIIPLGPIASQEAIKLLGTNGGGYFGVNSSHPFENPTQLSNFIGLLALFLIPCSLTITYGVVIGSKKHGFLILLSLMGIFFLGLVIALWSEFSGNPNIPYVPYLEGKEERFGILSSTLWSVATAASGNGSINAAITSLTPLSSGIALFNLMLSQSIFGGIGSGLCSIIMFILLTLFLSGLMIGRTPEYLGKKIEKEEVQWISLTILVPSFLILIGSSLSIILPHVLENMSHKGPHGLSEILYAYASTSTNNGSSFASLNTNTLFFNLIFGFIMLLGRFSIFIPCIVVAGLFAKKKASPPSLAMFSPNTFLFFALFIGTILMIGALTFFPSLMLGPIAEHFLMRAENVF